MIINTGILFPEGHFFSMANTYLEVRDDCGTRKPKAIISLCFIFSILLVPIAVLMVVSPNKHQNLQNQLFFVGLAILCLFGLAWSIRTYLNKRRVQRSSPPTMYIDEKGVSFGVDLANNISWSSVTAISENIKLQANYPVEAELTLTFTNGESQTIELLSKDLKPEQIVTFAKESLRRSRGVEVGDLKNRLISCPHCAQQTDSLKAIQSGIIVFLLFYYRYELKQYVCCRLCAKKILGRDSAINLLTCHVTWPILWFAAVVLPQSGKLLFDGHDAKALEQIT